jgi:polysaccharide deacetylase family protein (PEP-CTERM system associated)
MAESPTAQVVVPAPPHVGRVAHHFTVDVEEYFQVSAFESVISRHAWAGIPSRVASGVARLLELLARFDARGTFFILGWVAERQPHLVREIALAGHEVASHGWDHRRVTTLTPEEFRSSIRRTKGTLEDLAGTPVRGFRAPSFSIVPGFEWALDVLLEEGHAYDSSLFPVARRGYGYPAGKRDPHWIVRPAGRLAELPPATLRACGLTLPAGGGAYFRLFPYALVAAALRQSERRGVAGTFYIHPWELDPDQPRMQVSVSTKIRHYGGLRRTSPRLQRLLREFRFISARETLETL